MKRIEHDSLFLLYLIDGHMRRTADFQNREVEAFAMAMDALFSDFVQTARSVQAMPHDARCRALIDAGWPIEMARAFAAFNAGALTRSELAAAVAKAIVISQNHTFS